MLNTMLKNFIFANPTKLIFGEKQIAQIAHQIPLNSKVLITYGQGSIKSNGIYTQVIQALSQHQFLEYGGIQPNPCYEDLLPIVEFIKQHQIDYLLAVGGGSVIDATKFLSVAPFLDNPWEHLTAAKPFTKRLPLGTVLTLPATGSEANGAYVISRRSTQQKLGFINPPVYPEFSILDPSVVASLSKRQIGNGIVDSFTHVMEQYLTYPVNARLQDGFAETILRTLIETGPQVLSNPKDSINNSNFMLATTFALNGIIGLGVPQDWTTHRIGHELTALYNLDHAQTLAIVLPAVMQIQREQKRDKLLQYARTVWQIPFTESVETSVNLAIQKTRDFFESVGVKTHLADYGIKNDISSLIPERLAQQNMLPLGERLDINFDRMQQIMALC